MTRFLFLFAIVTTIASGQVASGTLSGYVVDESSALVPGATVMAHEENTGFTRATVTSAEGTYAMEGLPPGRYTVTAQKPGFRTTTSEHVGLEVNQRARLDLKLYVGQERETVTATASVSPLQTDEPSIGYRLDNSTTQALPLAMRNVISLVTLGPGAIPRQLGGFGHDVVNDVQEGSRGSVALNPPINGSRSTMNGFLLDGASDTDRNTFAVAVYPPMDSVQEFRIQTSLAPAEFPQSGGGAVDVVTRSGGQQFHGSAFEYLRNEATAARNYFADPSAPTPISRQNQFGGSIGGRLPAPNTFFFATYEGLRAKIGSPVQSIVPPASIRAGDFTGGNTIYDPTTLDAAGARTPFPGNMIPAGHIDPIAATFLSKYEPLPNLNSTSGNNFVDATPNTNQNDAVLGRIDHQFRNQSQISGRYTLNAEQNRIAGSFPVRPTAESVRAQQAALSYTYSRTSWLNEARLSFTRLRMFDTPESAFQTNVAAQLGVGGLSSDPANYGLPYFQPSDYSLVTDSPTLPQVQRDNLWNASEGVSWMRGAHTLKAGFDFMHFQFNYRQSQLARGQFFYTGAFTSAAGTPDTSGDGFADFLLGYPSNTSRAVGTTQAYLRQNTYGGYIQDDWRVNSRLTLNFGLRYDYASPYTEARDNLLNLDYSDMPAPPSPVRVNTAVRPDRRNFAPRLGAAWRLPIQGETVFRAGYGIYYSQEIAIETYDLVLNGIRTEINEVNGAQAPLLTTKNGFPQTASTGFPTYFGIDPGVRTPYVQQWTASIQHEFPGHILGEVSYVGSKGTHLGRFRQFNTPLHVETGENLDPRPGDLQSLRTWPSLGQIIQRQHIANSSFNSLQIKAEKRLNARVALLASFVWSKSIDDADSVIPGQYDSYGAQDERNLRLERGLSFFNVGRRISAGYVVSLPSARFAGPLLRNWQLSGIVTLQDGTPLNPVYFAADYANTGTPNRPDVVPGVSVNLPRSQRTIEEFFNRDAFTAPAPYHFGNAGRDILPGPGNNIFDFALDRRFRIGERQQLNFRAESFNTFNHPNWGIPGPYPDFGPFFGQIFSVGDPRRIQFAIRYDF